MGNGMGTGTHCKAVEMENGDRHFKNFKSLLLLTFSTICIKNNYYITENSNENLSGFRSCRI